MSQPFDLAWQQQYPHKVSDTIYALSTASDMRLVRVERAWPCQQECLEDIAAGTTVLGMEYGKRHLRWHIPCAQRAGYIVIVVNGLIQMVEEEEGDTGREASPDC